MSIAADLVLITTDPETGRSLLDSSATDAVLGGALLVDLVAAERCAVEGETKKAKVRLVDAAPLGRTAHDQALSRLRPDREPKASSVVPRLGKGARPLLAAELVEAEALAERREKVLGIFPVTRYDVVDMARHQRLLSEVRQVLLGHARPGETTGALVGLLHAADVVKRLVPKPERTEAKRRAKEIAKGEWAGTAAEAAVAAASSAASAAIVVAVAASSGDGGASS